MACSCSASLSAPGMAMPPPWKNPQVVTSSTAGVLLALGFIGGYLGLPHAAAVLLYVAAVLIGGYYFGREALEAHVVDGVAETQQELLRLAIEMAAARARETGTALNRATVRHTKLLLYAKL